MQRRDREVGNKQGRGGGGQGQESFFRLFPLPNVERPFIEIAGRPLFGNWPFYGLPHPRLLKMHESITDTKNVSSLTYGIEEDN